MMLPDYRQMAAGDKSVGCGPSSRGSGEPATWRRETGRATFERPKGARCTTRRWRQRHLLTRPPSARERVLARTLVRLDGASFMATAASSADPGQLPWGASAAIRR